MSNNKVAFFIGFYGKDKNFLGTKVKFGTLFCNAELVG